MLERLREILVVVAVLSVGAQVQAQGNLTIEQVTAGVDIPAKVAIADMTDDYKPLVLGSNTVLGSLMFGDASGSFSPQQYMGISWSKFEKLTIEGKRYLAVYRCELSSYLSGHLGPEARLFLVNLDSVPEIGFAPPTCTLAGLKKLASSPDTAAFGDPRSKTLSNAKQLAVAYVILLADYDDVAPYVQGTDQLFRVMRPYLKTTEFTKTLNPKGRFLYNMALAGANQNSLEKPMDTVVFYETEPWPDGKRVVAFADTHVRIVDADKWKTLQPSLNLKLKKVAKPMKPNQDSPIQP